MGLVFSLVSDVHLKSRGVLRRFMGLFGPFTFTPCLGSGSPLPSLGAGGGGGREGGVPAVPSDGPTVQYRQGGDELRKVTRVEQVPCSPGTTWWALSGRALGVSCLTEVGPCSRGLGGDSRRPSVEGWSETSLRI